MSLGLSLALLHLHVFSYHLCLGNTKYHFSFHLYPKLSISDSSRLGVWDSLHRSAHSHVFLEVSWANGALWMELLVRGAPIPAPVVGLTLPLPLSSCVCWSTFNFSCHFLFLPLQYCFPKLSSLSIPNTDVISCIFGQGLETIAERGFILTFFQPLRKGPIMPQAENWVRDLRRRASEKGEKKCDSMLLEKQRVLSRIKYYKFLQ